MVDGHAYKDHGINFEDFFCLNFHISHFLCSLKSVLRLKGMKSRSMQCVEADLHESRQDNTGLSAAQHAQVQYRNAQLHHPSHLPHTFFTNALNQSLSPLPLDQQHFFLSPHPILTTKHAFPKPQHKFETNFAAPCECGC